MIYDDHVEIILLIVGIALLAISAGILYEAWLQSSEAARVSTQRRDSETAAYQLWRRRIAEKRGIIEHNTYFRI